jgi:hypothetical protein
MVNLRLAWATWQDPVSKKKKKSERNLQILLSCHRNQTNKIYRRPRCWMSEEFFIKIQLINYNLKYPKRMFGLLRFSSTMHRAPTTAIKLRGTERSQDKFSLRWAYTSLGKI